MEIRSAHMYQEEEAEVLPPIDCSICGNKFQASDVMEFICRSCLDALPGHCPNCKGEYDDCTMDWGVDIETDQPYFWIIDCCCGYEFKSRPCSIVEMNEVGQQLHMTFLSFPKYELK
jgi:antirestriction protein